MTSPCTPPPPCSCCPICHFQQKLKVEIVYPTDGALVSHRSFTAFVMVNEPKATVTALVRTETREIVGQPGAAHPFDRAFTFRQLPADSLVRLEVVATHGCQRATATFILATWPIIRVKAVLKGDPPTVAIVCPPNNGTRPSDFSAYGRATAGSDPIDPSSYVAKLFDANNVEVATGIFDAPPGLPPKACQWLASFTGVPETPEGEYYTLRVTVSDTAVPALPGQDEIQLIISNA